MELRPEHAPMDPAPQPTRARVVNLEPDAAVLQRARSLPATNVPFPGTNTQPSPHDGEVMGSPRVFAIYIGRDFGDLNQGLNKTALEINSFLHSLTTSRYMTLLSEYSVGMPQFIGSVYLDNDGAVVTLTTDQVQQDLKDVIDYPAASGLYPPGPIVQPDINEVNLLYVLFMPSTTTLQITNRGKTLQCGPGGICGYHSWGWHNKIYLASTMAKPICFTQPSVTLRAPRLCLMSLLKASLIAAETDGFLMSMGPRSGISVTSVPPARSKLPKALKLRATGCIASSAAFNKLMSCRHLPASRIIGIRPSPTRTRREVVCASGIYIPPGS
jgi:hypothetical protein